VSEFLPGGSPIYDRLKEAWDKLLWIGIVMTILGIAAVVFPLIATLVATLFVGWLLLISGGITLAGSFSIQGTGPFFGALMASLLSVAAGVFLVVNPLAGEVTLTLILGAILMVQGAFELLFAFEMRPLGSWTGMLISALSSIAVAILIIAAWPGSSLKILGILLGFNFISSGIGYIAVSQTLEPEGR
jgi:uncharacterized membrane protein HdeD (DUF308 family)